MFHGLEQRAFFFTAVLVLVVSLAGVIEMIPSLAIQPSQPIVVAKPYTVLELAGRQVYIKNGCIACHTQKIEPIKHETDRYGTYSVSGEYAYDRPLLWGSSRTGPDLLRVGNRRTTDWHEIHMKDPTSVVPTSVMPSYKHLFENRADIATAYADANTQKQVFGVPYDKADMPSLGSWYEANAQAIKEATLLVADMKNPKVKEIVADGQIPQIVALIAYLNTRR